MDCRRLTTTGADRDLHVCGVCVCVCAHFAAGGQCMPDSHCPTKTLSVCGDIWPDQPDVPAFGLASGPPVALE